MGPCVSLHVNYLYLLSKATGDPPHHSQVVLDYGCGSGQIIEEGRKAGVQMYGADTFYEGGTTRPDIEKKGWLGNIVREIEHGVIPFDDRFFDLVVSNMVFEHIQDLDGVLSEILRILKPGGTLLCMFPSKDVILEGHCGLPFIHWFPKRSRLRFYYAVALRKMGFGHFKGDKSASQWASNFLEWLDRFTCYRDSQTIFTSFRRYFSISLIESDYITYRLNHHGRTRLSRLFQLPFVRPIGCQLFRRLAGLVILARKADTPDRILITGNPQEVFSGAVSSPAQVKGF
jgi:SAM-dependent methyltransferase